VQPTGTSSRDAGATGKAVPGTDAERRARARRLHDEAKDRYGEGRYREALDRLVLAVDSDSQDKDLHYVLAFVAEKLLELDLALQHYRSSAELEPDLAERQRLANVIGRVEAANQHLRLHPHDARLPERLPPSLPPAPPGPSSLRLGAYVTGGIGGTALLVATVAGAYALYVQPDADAWTGAEPQIGRLNADAHSSYAAGMVAEVSGAVGAVSMVVALVLALIEEGPATAPEPSARNAHWRLGPAGGPAVLRF
jgi:tetratricopeptide (TPR) repeat protein